LGPRLGPRVNEVKRALAEADGSTLKRELDETGAIEVAGERLTAEEVEVRADRHDDFALAQEGPWAVALDLDLDESLRVEGLARELVRAVNELRKDLGLHIADRIVLTVTGTPRVRQAVEAHRDWIRGEVLAIELTVADNEGRTLDL